MEWYYQEHMQQMETLMPCWGMLMQGEDVSEDTNLIICHKKIDEEHYEAGVAIQDYLDAKQKGEPEADLGKRREKALEEIWDNITSLYTAARVLASEPDCLLELTKVNIKNELRGYHRQQPKP